MCKLDKLTFYSKLQDLFDSIPPEDISHKITEAIQFIERNNQTEIAEINDAKVVLNGIKQAFEDSMKEKGPWNFYLCHSEKGYQINIKVFYNFLSDNEDFVSLLEILTENWYVLITDDNIEDFKNVQKIITSLKYTFRKTTYATW